MSKNVMFGCCLILSAALVIQLIYVNKIASSVVDMQLQITAMQHDISELQRNVEDIFSMIGDVP